MFNICYFYCWFQILFHYYKKCDSCDKDIEIHWDFWSPVGKLEQKHLIIMINWCAYVEGKEAIYTEP